ncbi:MAG: cytochrome c biogenesis protein ResB [Verrucomicrobia bacterium]|nr:cytochrome c biogenesis protein ResB [Verrucomicrobiota bacterium]
MTNKLWKLLTSLRLTVVLLAFSIVLVFIGTVAQADEGLYQAQARYFKHWFVNGFTFFGHKVPVPLPGGYLLGTLLLVNLTAAHISRFQWTWKKLGIHLTHLGVILLLVGQLATDLLSRETQMRFAEGETRAWSESGMDYELIFVTDADADNEEVVAIPQKLLAPGAELKHEKLPFTVRVKEFWPNSTRPEFRAPMMQSQGAPLTTNGVGASFNFRPEKVTHAMDDKNVPVAILEIITPGGSPGTWVAPGWVDDEPMSSFLRRVWRQDFGKQLADNMAAKLTRPQTIEASGKRFTFSLRPARTYTPFTVTLLKTTHTTYPGRPDLPKDFRSRVRIQNPAKGEDREVEIFMNNPLRYAGLTFFQYQMVGEEMAAQRGEKPSSVLQVVRNPGWITPYAGCIIVGVGMVIQFMIHLVGFVQKRKTA